MCGYGTSTIGNALCSLGPHGPIAQMQGANKRTLRDTPWVHPVPFGRFLNSHHAPPIVFTAKIWGCQVLDKRGVWIQIALLV